MLEQVLKKAIPSRLGQFRKLTPDRSPYYFDSWKTDSGEAILSYWFWNKNKTKKNTKRVFVREIESLLRSTCDAGVITRGDFERYCPQTNGDGDCGFAVIFSILEFLQLVKRGSRGKHTIIGQAKILQLLRE